MPKFSADAQHLALLQGDRCGFYRGTTAAVTNIPGMTAGQTSVMVDPDLFEGLLEMGVVSAKLQRAGLTVHTKTGLQAKIAVVVDPLRQTKLTEPANGEAVSSKLFDNWLASALAVGNAVGPLVYTWRSNVFSYQRNVLAVARLDSAWPVYWVVQKSVLDTFARGLLNRIVNHVSASRLELLVAGDTFQARATAPELVMPEKAIELLAQIKPHKGEVECQVSMPLLLPAIRQLKALVAAHRAKDIDVSVSERHGALRIHAAFFDIEVPGVTFCRAPIRTTSSALLALDAIEGETLNVMRATNDAANTPLVVRGKNISLILAAQREGTP